MAACSQTLLSDLGGRAVEFDKAIAVIEGYAKSYIHYILGFFGELGTQAGEIADDDKAAPELSLNDGSLLIFGLFNALVGAALQGLFVEKLQFNDITFPQAVIVQVCYWLLLAIILHGLLNLGRGGSHFSGAITVVLQVAPVAYVVGAYAAFVAYFVALAATSGVWAPWWAAFASGAVDATLLAIFLPRAVKVVAGPSQFRRRVSAYGVVILVAFIHATVLYYNLLALEGRI